MVAASYAVSIDNENGPSIATGTNDILVKLSMSSDRLDTAAWGTIHTILFSNWAFSSRRPGPILLTTGIVASTLAYASEMVDDWIN